MARRSFTITDTKFIFSPNLRGAPDRYNPQGAKRNVNIVVPEDKVEALLEEGFNVRTREPRPELPDDETVYSLKLLASYGGYSDPTIVLVSCPIGADPRACARVPLDEDTVQQIDFARVISVDVTFAPYHHQQGTSAYIQKMYVVVAPDELDSKWGFIEGSTPEEDYNE